MLKKSITYEDYNGEMATEDFFFHLSKAELVEIEREQITPPPPLQLAREDHRG